MVEDEPIRLLIDEDVWLGLAAALREKGFDVIHVYEVARGSLNDREQIAFAVQQQRAILTHNKRHYIPFVAEYYWADKVHYGVLVIDQLPRGELLRREASFALAHLPGAAGAEADWTKLKNFNREEIYGQNDCLLWPGMHGLRSLHRYPGK